MASSAINWDSRAPLAEQLRNIVKRAYVDGCAPGAKLPTEFQLAAEFGVNRTIARRAVELLRKEGFVVRRPRHGTFIANNARKELTVAYYEENAARRYAFAELLRRFEEKYPSVRIKHVTLPTSGYGEITSRMMDEGNLDLLRISVGLFNAYNPSVQFLSLNDFYRTHAAMTLADPWVAFRSKKTHYGLPLAYGPTVIVYNRDVFRQAGVDFPNDNWTLPQFEATAAKLTMRTSDNPAPDRYGFLCPHILNRWALFVYSHGGSIWDAASSKFAITEESGMLGLNVLRRMVQSKVCAPFHGASDPYRLFVRGKAAMTIASYHALASLKTFVDFDFGVTAFPACRKKVNLMIVDGVAVAKKTVNLDAVNEFLKFCLSDDAQRYLSRNCGVLSVRPDVLSPPVAGMPFNYELHRQLKGRAVFPELPLNDLRLRSLADETALYVNGMQSAEEYCANLAAYTVIHR